MKLTLKAAISVVAIAFPMVVSAYAQPGDVLPSAEHVVSMMMQLDSQRQSDLNGYVVTRHYVAVNKNRHAEMVVHVTCDSNGAKQFTVLGEEGSGSIRKHVFYKLLSEETEASRRGTRNSTRLTPDNYDFKVIGEETLETGPAYILAVTPKQINKYLINGKIWVDENDYSIVRIEGQPARNPSFWVRKVHFVHTYEKVGPFWFASSTHTTSEIRIFGESELTIENSNYTLNPPRNSEASSIHLENEARLRQ